MARATEVAVFWDYETCPSPGALKEVDVVRLIKGFVTKRFGPRATIKVFNAYVDLRTGGTASLRLETTKHSQQRARQRSRPKSTWAEAVLIDCPNNLKEDTVGAIIIRDMLAYATRKVPSNASANILLITCDANHKSNFTSPLSMLRFLDHTVILVTANPQATSLKSSVAQVFNWYTEVSCLFLDSMDPGLGHVPDSTYPSYQSPAYQSYIRNLPPARETALQSDSSDELDSLHSESGPDPSDRKPIEPTKRFRYLIRCLQFYESIGCPYPTIKLVSRSLAHRRATHLDGFSSMTEYVSNAAVHGIVEICGQGMDSWLRLLKRTA